jgi:hypothetical protein
MKAFMERALLDIGLNRRNQMCRMAMYAAAGMTHAHSLLHLLAKVKTTTAQPGTFKAGKRHMAQQNR